MTGVAPEVRDVGIRFDVAAPGFRLLRAVQLVEGSAYAMQHLRDGYVLRYLRQLWRCCLPARLCLRHQLEQVFDGRSVQHATLSTSCPSGLAVAILVHLSFNEVELHSRVIVSCRAVALETARLDLRLELGVLVHLGMCVGSARAEQQQQHGRGGCASVRHPRGSSQAVKVNARLLAVSALVGAGIPLLLAVAGAPRASDGDGSRVVSRG